MPEKTFHLTASSLVAYFSLFRRRVGWKLYLFILCVLSVGVIDTFSVTMLLPVLSQLLGEDAVGIDSQNIVLNALAEMGSSLRLRGILLVWSSVFVLKGFALFLLYYIQSVIVTRLGMHLKEELALSFRDMSYVRFIKEDAGYLNNLVAVEAQTYSNALQKFCEFLTNALYAVLFVAFSLFLNWKVCLSLAVGMMGMLLLSKYLFKYGVQFSYHRSRKSASVQTLLFQMTSSFKYLKATEAFDYVIHHLRREINELRRLQLTGNVLSNISAFIREPLVAVIVFATIYILVAIMGMSFSVILVPLALLYKAGTEVGNAQYRVQLFSSLCGSIHMVEQSLSDFGAHRELDAGEDCPPFHEAIEFKNVSFSHGNKPILTNISARFASDTSVGIVGASGAGKTTLVDLFIALYKPDAGEILFDGKPYARFRRSSLRAHFSYVTQESIIFDDTVLNNISLWETDCPGIDVRAKVQKAAEAAQAWEFITALPEGLDTIVGERGVTLSGGQRQRIAIARELYRQRPILILDEATSALDFHAESAIQKSIEALHGKQTLVIISHRLSALKKCDFIYVLDNGSLVESGTWTDLTQKGKEPFTSFFQRNLESDI